MKSCYKEKTSCKKKYVFFSDPDVIVKLAETSAVNEQARQFIDIEEWQKKNLNQTSTDDLINLPIETNLKSSNDILVQNPIKPYPFTFITAVKRKLAIGEYSETCKKVREPVVDKSKRINKPGFCTNPKERQTSSQSNQKMDYIKPLKVPDLKISPKTLDYSVRESSSLSEANAKKFDMLSKDNVQKQGKTAKSADRVQRKLDFSSSDVSLLNSENPERLKTPDFCFSTNLVKKKDHSRDGSREKENRTKRIKKDDSSVSKTDESSQDISKRFRNIRHVSRKDAPESANKKIRNERFLSNAPRESDFGPTKPKSKNFATSTVKRDEDKRYRGLNTQYSKSSREKSLELKGRSFSNESINISEKNVKLQDRMFVKESFKEISSDINDRKNKNEDQSLISLRLDDQKNKMNPESRHSKQQSRSSSYNYCRNLDTIPKEQNKRIIDKHKPSTSKIDSKYSATSSDILEEIETASDSNINFSKRQSQNESPEIPSQSSKVKESEKSSQNIQNLIYQSNQQNINRNSELEVFSMQNNRKNENSTIHSVTSDLTQGNTNTELQSSIDTSFSEMLLDPRRISFRDDSYSQQEEFSNLVTPDMNLMLRSKRRKQFLQENEKEPDHNSLKNKSVALTETEKEGILLLHPTALHMQFQAELNLFDSFNESLRQVMDVESSFYNAKHEEGRKILQKEKLANEEMKKQLVALQSDWKVGLEKTEVATVDKVSHDADDSFVDKRPCEGSKLTKKGNVVDQEDVPSHRTSVRNSSETADDNSHKKIKPLVKVAEVQTQTANDIATQTDVNFSQSNMLTRLEELSGITYQRGPIRTWDIPRLSLESLDQGDDFGHVDDISLSSKMRAMSEISLHETTSSIKTETGTEISISTRDVTCSFNKDLALEMAQLIQDEKQRYDKIQMLFKSREKTLYDRTKKLVKLEEQKRQLRDTGQDSRISSVKKKQRALLLKLQQEKDEMNRLKELHKIASQERKLMLQKQRDMFNPEMSTKNILTKLKRSADSQSPRRLSGPMKGYDIRSNSSMSSLIDSDKSQIDRSLIDTKLETPDASFHKNNEQYLTSDVNNSAQELSENAKFESVSSTKCSASFNASKPHVAKTVEKGKYDIKSRKFEEKMPKADILRQIDLHSKLKQGSRVALSEQSQERESFGLPPMYPIKTVFDHEKSESDTVIEGLSRNSKLLQLDPHGTLRRKAQSNLIYDTDAEEVKSKRTQTSPNIDQVLQINSKGSKKSEKPLVIERDSLKKLQHGSDSKSSSKRKGSKSHKAKSTSGVVMENILRPKSDSQVWEEVIGHHNKRSKLDVEQSDDNYQNSILEELDFNESQSSLRALLKHSKAVKDKNYQLLRDIASDREAKENVTALKALDKKSGHLDNFSRKEDKDGANLGNISTRSQVSTLTISRHSSGDSEKSYSRSVVIRSQDHRFKTSKKLEQILNAREAALASRRTCVEEWIAWHTRLREEENRVARMEQAAYKLVNAASKALSFHDTTVSSDASDVEGRIELLAHKLADRRSEMTRLKKEAKKQAKQRLRAMEASLLNQIQKYDTTINEMRKTLDAKKESIKNSDKAAVESKSVADFKVPEIPIKRIQDIYKSSDLLQSRSDSNLISSKNRENLIGSSRLLENRCSKDEISCHSKSQNIVKGSQFFDEEAEEVNPIRSESTDATCTKEPQQNKSKESSERSSFSRPKSISEDIVLQQPESNGLQQINSSHSQNSIISESVLSDINTFKSQVEPLPTPNSVKNLAEDKISKASMSLSVQEISEVVDGVGCPKTDSIEEAVPSVSAEDFPLSFSRKLDYIGLNSKHLNDDISTLESDLKTLSEMMLQISNKSLNKLKLHKKEENPPTKDYSEKRTSEDISEYLSDSESLRDSNQSFNRSKSEKRQIVEDAISIYDVNNIENRDEVKNDHDIEDRVSEMLFRTMSGDDTSKIYQKIDFKAKSKEMLSEIEKSIISDHVNCMEAESNISHQTFEEGMRNLHKESEVLSNDLTSLEGDIKSISEMISKAAQSNSTFDKTLGEKKPHCFAEDTFKSNSVTDPSLENSVSESPEKCVTPLISDIQDSCNVSEDLKISINDFSNTEIESEKQQELPEMLVLVVKKPQPSNDDDSNKNVIQNCAHVLDITKERVEEDHSSNISGHHLEESSINENSSLKKDEVESTNDSSQKGNMKENSETEGISLGKASMDEDWTTSDSFELHKVEETATTCMKEDHSKVFDISGSYHSITTDLKYLRGEENLSIENEKLNYEGNSSSEVCDIGNDSTFIPRGESTNIEVLESCEVSEIQSKLDNSLDVTECDNKVNQEQKNLIQKGTEDEETLHLELDTEINSLNTEESNLTNLQIKDKGKNEFEETHYISSVHDSTTLVEESTSVVDNHLCETNIILEPYQSTPVISISLSKEVDEGKKDFQKLLLPQSLIISELEPHSLEGHGLTELEVEPKVIFPEHFENEDEEVTTKDILMEDIEISECMETLEEESSSEGEQLDNLVEVAESKLETVEKVYTNFTCNSENFEKAEENIFNSQKTIQLLRNPQYEDISEESIEISAILDQIESNKPQKFTSIPEKYEVVHKSEDVVKILDEILSKAVLKTDKQFLNFNVESHQDQLPQTKYDKKAVEQEENDIQVASTEIPVEQCYDKENREIDDSSESSEDDAQRENSEIEEVSPKDPNNSRLDIDALDDDLLTSISAHQNLESKAEFHVTPVVTNAEKEIIAMIDKLKASLKQPGLEVAELDATLLRIEQLQIELEIKRLEAEEVSYYVREIPNKPPPPYTPPGSGRLSASQGSPSPPPVVIPTNIDELTAFTEKATSLIFKSKECGEDIMSLEAPPEIWDLSKDTETLKKDRRIYNTFLFDLCKETIAEVYRMEYEKPGPSWTRPNVKTKPAIKIPKNIEELTEYVNKEIATLFGFKTKLQRENMVMRWSRKRRDRVDELLAREAQAEEDEWTKFHYDELAVKNELTVAILDSLISETVNVVKSAYTKKQKCRA